VEKVLRSAVRLVMEPARRLMQGDARQWSEQTPTSQEFEWETS